MVMAAAVILSLALALPAAATRDPRAPTQKHTKAGMQRARSLTLRLGDLGANWTKVQTKASPPCSIEPDESKLVETGSIDPTFVLTGGSGIPTQIGSSVTVFRSAGEARTDWRLTAKLALFRGCLLEGARVSFGKQVQVRVLSAKALAPPKVGQRSLHYRIVLATTSKTKGGTATQGVLVAEFVGFNSGRASVVLHAVSALRLPPAVVSGLVNVLAGRLQSGPGAI